MLVSVYMHPDSQQTNSTNNPFVIFKVVQEAGSNGQMVKGSNGQMVKWSNGHTSMLLILQQLQRFACA